MPQRNMTPAELLDAARTVAERWPDAELVKNHVGNLSVVEARRYVAFIDLREGRIDEVGEVDGD
jgi:hypothetical protein